MDELLGILGKNYDESMVWSLLEGIWQRERWFDAPRQEAAMRYVQQSLLSAGIADATVDVMPADGRTRFQDRIAHLAWDCDSATLAMAEPGHVLADRKITPRNTVMWSAPLPPTTAEVVDGDALPAITPEAVNGKWVLTAHIASETKRRLLGMRPAGIAGLLEIAVRHQDFDRYPFDVAQADQRMRVLHPRADLGGVIPVKPAVKPREAAS